MDTQRTDPVAHNDARNAARHEPTPADLATEAAGKINTALSYLTELHAALGIIKDQLPSDETLAEYQRLVRNGRIASNLVTEACAHIAEAHRLSGRLVAE
jgi:hypothetical protein